MSIRIRLTVWYVLLLTIVLIIFGATFYVILSVSLNTEVNRNLQDRATQVVTGIIVENSRSSIRRTGKIVVPDLDIFAFSPQSIYIQITDVEGQIIQKSRNLEPYTLPVQQGMLDAVGDRETNFADTRIQGVGLRIYSVPIIFSEQAIGMIQIAQPLTEMETLLRWTLLALIGGTILAMIITTLLGAMMANLSLRPIDRITSTANQIVSAEDLGQRLPVRGNNDELDRLSQTMNSMLARLDNFFQAQARLSADVSHELRTPLTIIRGNVDLLRDGENDPPEERAQTLAAIDSAMDRMARIVSDLLLLSQADAGITLTMRPIELELLVLDVFQQVHALSSGVGLKLGHTESVAGYGDADRLKQLLINLVHNGLKHTPRGGCVTISLYGEDDWARISVADTGSGISPEDLPYIFDRFYRAKGQKQRGSGLGLAIAKWIAEAHKGTLEVESQLGNGSTFILRLPFQPDYKPQTQVADTKPMRTPFRVSI